jgi:predicted transglutaminase-like cysteine proteinase
MPRVCTAAQRRSDRFRWPMRAVLPLCTFVADARRLVALAWIACTVLCAVPAQAADELRLQRGAVAAGPRAVAAWQQLRPLLRSLHAVDAQAQLQAINHFFNTHIEFATDEQAWGQVDYWASPLEALQRGRGDCEDYAIAKYFSLLAVGMPAARLRLVYVRAQLDDGAAQAHMVLAYYPSSGAEPLILDNLVDDILPASRRGDLSPVFSFNSEGLWQGVGPVSAGNPASRLTRWRDAMAKARAEGFP